MQSLKESQKALRAQLNTVKYIMKSCPGARLEGDVFVDDSVNIHNADGFVFKMPDKRSTGLLLTLVRPYKKLKRRPNEKDPLQVFASKEYNLAPHHIELLLNNIDHREALKLLQKALGCQDDSKAA